MNTDDATWKQVAEMRGEIIKILKTQKEELRNVAHKQKLEIDLLRAFNNVLKKRPAPTRDWKDMFVAIQLDGSWAAYDEGGMKLETFETKRQAKKYLKRYSEYLVSAEDNFDVRR